MKDLLIKIAYDQTGKIVFAKDAVKGERYFCPKCGEELIFKKSGKTGPGSRCPHFAHKGGGGHNCDPESVLHATFKKEAANLLSGYISEKRALNIEWVCKECGSKYSGNLLFTAKSVEVEYDLKECRPDIAILDDSGRIRIAIEIVNTHSPEEKTLAFYREHGIVLIQYNVNEGDLLRIEDKMKKPDEVSLCLNSNCKKFNPKMLNRRLTNTNCTCNNCKKQFIAFFVEYSSPLGHVQYMGINNNDLLELGKAGITINMLQPVRLTMNKYSIPSLATKCSCRRLIYLPLNYPLKRRRNPRL